MIATRISSLSIGFLITNLSLAATFTPLGELPGGLNSSGLIGISPDGSAVAGWSNSTKGREAIVWTKQNGIIGLGDLPGGDFISRAQGVSNGGLVVVGESDILNGTEAFVWDSINGMTSLGSLPGAQKIDSIARDVSADGNIVIGDSHSSNGEEAFIWDSTHGMVGLGDFQGGEFNSHAFSISEDGSTVVGSGEGINGHEAFIWTAHSGLIGLGDIPGGDFSSVARGISADGKFVVGRGVGSVFDSEPFIWDSLNGMTSLGMVPNYNAGTGQAVSYDGSRVVGYVSGHSGWAAMIWDSKNGISLLQDTLETLGVDLTGWKLIEASDLSADGRVIAGYGTNPSGNVEAWIVTLPIPEPNSFALVMLATFGIASRRR